MSHSRFSRRSRTTAFTYVLVSGVRQTGTPAGDAHRFAVHVRRVLLEAGPALAAQKPKLNPARNESTSMVLVTEVPGTGPAGPKNGPVTSFSKIL